MSADPGQVVFLPRRSESGGARSVVLVVLVALLALALLYLWAALSWSFSEGQRAGYVQKFSRKGWVCKTWEGELAMVNLPGTAPEIFRFSVRNDAVAEKINQALGNRVVLSYQQHLGLPTDCFGETSYFVVDVRPATN
ncbi:MAG: hypothetical protein U0002_20560 [Thermoanaerobaculia bacterium]